MRNVFVFAAVFLFSFPATAREFRVQQVPNGPDFSCNVCHEQGNTGYVNAFGVQVLEALSNQNVVWSELAQRDADGDGYSNGLELGDPDGTWRRGDPHPSGRATNPGLYDSNLCGNGIEEPGEECENDDVGDATCQDAGFHAGRVVCNSICRIDTSFCINCGNGQVDSDEECENADVDGRTCAGLGYDGGTLGCLANCTLDTSSCTGEPTPICGDGIIVGSEDCEGENLGGASCVTVGYEDGGLLRCNADCTYDIDRCLGENSNDEDERVAVPGGDGPALPPGAFANDDDGCSAAGGATPRLPIVLMLLGLFLTRTRRK
jgi:hypothetical protein